MKSMHGGAFRKYVTVMSNAKNNPSLRLSLGGTIKAYIDISSRYIRLAAPPERKELTEEVVLSTELKDLTVSEVVFKPRSEGGSEGPAWQSSLPLYVTHSLAKPDSVKADGFMDYKLKLSLAYSDKESKHGDFVIKTNHPKKKEFVVSGMIEGRYQ